MVIVNNFFSSEYIRKQTLAFVLPRTSVYVKTSQMTASAHIQWISSELFFLGLEQK